jgi:dihydroorotase-like cyclic amidohydrolase
VSPDIWMLIKTIHFIVLVQLEGEATARAIRLAKFVNTPLYVVHVMSIDALDEIVRARKSGIFHIRR